MRPLIPVVIASTLLLTAPTALASPTCKDADGDTIRCGTPGAMPVGWALSPQQRLDRRLSRPPQPIMGDLFGLICVLGCFFALIALMPEFDGRAGSDWDKQEGDDEESG